MVIHIIYMAGGTREYDNNKCIDQDNDVDISFINVEYKILPLSDKIFR